MSESDLLELLKRNDVSGSRIRLARWIESGRVQSFIIIAILLNALILGLETSTTVMSSFFKK